MHSDARLVKEVYCGQVSACGDNRAVPGEYRVQTEWIVYVDMACQVPGASSHNAKTRCAGSKLKMPGSATPTATACCEKPWRSRNGASMRSEYT